MKKSKLKSNNNKPNYEVFVPLFFNFVIEEDGNVPEILLIDEKTKAFLPTDSKHKNMRGVKKIFCHNKHLNRFKKVMKEKDLGSKARFYSTGLVVSTKQGCYVFIPSVYTVVEENKRSLVSN